MPPANHTLPPHFRDCALTASFMVALYNNFLRDAESGGAEMRLPPVAPAHLDEDMIADCRAIAESLSHAVQNKVCVSWDAKEYTKDTPKTAKYNARREDSLLYRYAPLTRLEDILGQQGHLKILEGPALIADVQDNALVYSLPNIIPPRRQESILQITWGLRDILETKTPRMQDRSEATLKGWRTAPTFFTQDGEWGYGATLLYPAGFQQGHRNATKGPSPSTAAASGIAAKWMQEFQVVGGLVDGILAIVHPELYHAAIALAEHMYTVHPKSRAILANWPSCYSVAQVIVNRETVRHRDMSSGAGWPDILLTLGSYGETAVMELRNLGICVPYDAGTMVILAGQLVVHGVPKVPADRICLAWYMDQAVFKYFDMEEVGMAVLRRRSTSG